jgi:hypothetical protein
MTRTAAALADVLTRENAALAALDFARATALLAEKQAAAGAFAATVEMAKDEALAARLRDLVVENRRLLEHAMLVQGRVLGLVARALRAPPPRYGAGGTPLRGAPVAPAVVSARV